MRVTVYNLQVANEKKRSGWGKKTEKTASTEGNIVMFSENMHKDIKEGHKRTYRSTETATRTKNENSWCKNHVNDEANGQNDREEIILMYIRCAFLDNLLRVDWNTLVLNIYKKICFKMWVRYIFNH